MRSRRKALVHQTIDSIPAGIYFTARDVVALMKQSGHGIRALTPHAIGPILSARTDVKNCGLSTHFNSTLWKKVRA